MSARVTPRVAQRQNPMQVLELVRGVPPVAGVGVGPYGAEETQLVVVAEGANGHLGQASNRTDPVHAGNGSADGAAGSSLQLSNSAQRLDAWASSRRAGGPESGQGEVP
jgi:hypothetical protein